MLVEEGDRALLSQARDDLVGPGTPGKAPFPVLHGPEGLI